MANHRIVHPMDKRGFVVETIGIIFIITLLAVGAYSTTTILLEHQYIGDSFTDTYYDLSRCVIEVSSDNLVYFENENDAIQRGFESAECNR